VARRLQASIRPGDLIARLGGDEFAVLCYHMVAAAARNLADRLALAVGDPIAINGNLLHISASVGVATATGCATGDELISRADHAMFTAKRSGREQQVTHG
jgi:diguanylate cyclase (GGDEF)-like protein